MAVDRWLAGNRLPPVLRDLSWRLEGLLEVAAEHDARSGDRAGVRRRLDNIVGYGLLEVRELITTTTVSPALHAASALQDCSIPEREELRA